MVKKVSSKTAAKLGNVTPTQSAVDTAIGVPAAPSAESPVAADIPPVFDIEALTSKASKVDNTSTPGIPNGFDIESLIIPINYGESFGVADEITNIRVIKSLKNDFVRAKSGDSLRVMVHEDKTSGVTYVLTPQIAALVPEVVDLVSLHRTVDVYGNQFLTRVGLPGEDGRRNLWHESLMQAIILAEKEWVRITATMSAGMYKVRKAKGVLAEPVWSEHTMKQLFEIAFAGKIISDESHPVIQRLFGAI